MGFLGLSYFPSILLCSFQFFFTKEEEVTTKNNLIFYIELFSKKSGGVKNCQFWDDLVYGQT